MRLFVKKEKRERILALASKASRRGDFRSDLLHDARSLDPGVLRRLAATSTVESIARDLRAAGARGLAFCISERDDVDGLELPLDDALGRVVGRESDSLVFALGSRAAYYENHEGERWLLVGPR